MIVRMEQTLSNLELAYMFTDSTGVICKALAPFQMGQFDMNISHIDGSVHLFHFNPHVGGSLKERFSFKLFENNVQVGTFVGASKGRFFKGYTYYEIEFCGQQYSLYAVGMGGKGFYLCLYDGDRLIAMVDKDIVVKNHKDTYTLYLESKNDFKLLAAAILYYDVISYEDFMRLTVHSVKRSYVITRNEELLSKVDLNFIERVKAEG